MHTKYGTEYDFWRTFSDSHTRPTVRPEQPAKHPCGLRLEPLPEVVPIASNATAEGAADPFAFGDEMAQKTRDELRSTPPAPEPGTPRTEPTIYSPACHFEANAKVVAYPCYLKLQNELADCERENARLVAERDNERDAYRKRDQMQLESDSIVASCGCLTKTNEVKYHKPGCKYRLICERDEARHALAAQSQAEVERKHEEMCNLQNQVDNFDVNWEQQKLIIDDLRARLTTAESNLATMTANAERERLDKENTERERDQAQAELNAVLAEWNLVVKASGSPTNGGLAGHITALRAQVEQDRMDKSMLIPLLSRAIGPCHAIGDHALAEEISRAMDAARSDAAAKQNTP